MSEDPLLWWRTKAQLYPSLATLARTYLACPSSSVASERLFSGAGIIYDKKSSPCDSSPEDNGAVVSYPVQKQDQVGQSDLVSRIYQGPDYSPNVFVCSSASQCNRVYGRASIWSVASSQNSDEEPHGSQKKDVACLEDFEDEDGLSCLIVPTFSMPQLLHKPEAEVPLWAWNSESTHVPRFSRGSQHWGRSSRDNPSKRGVNNCRCCRKRICKYCEETCLKFRSSEFLPGNTDVSFLSTSSAVSIRVPPSCSPKKSLSGKSHRISETCCACVCAESFARKCADETTVCERSHCFQNKNRRSIDLPQSLGTSVSVISNSIHGPCCCRSDRSQRRTGKAASCRNGSSSFRTVGSSAATSSLCDVGVLPDGETMRGSFIAPMMPASIISPYHRKIQSENFKARLFPSGPTIVTTIVPLGPQSTHMICPHCRSEVDTATKTSPSPMAWVASLLICCLGCPFGCCLIPCCIPSCMDVKHTCPKCYTRLGKYVQ
ncbi:LPS-induced tumor necrosis factor alpha factor [Trinorchestia longiramus]|nr:LPS-induced tumor necrosis factor alpha factor [Trinorchestia longiramus]